MYSETIKTLDLSAFVEKTLEIKMVDGTIIHLKRPTKAMVIQIQAIQECEAADKKDMVTAFVSDAMNWNIEGTEVNINDMPEHMVVAIFIAYLDFISELVSSPNS